ncbi:MAG: Bax inhibitor-1/YccA family protein [Candidatus Gracilibacteria bacterium]|jgi:hypothetical protein
MTSPEHTTGPTAPTEQLYGALSAQSAFTSKVLSLFGLAILITAAGTYTGYNYILATLVLNPSWALAIFAVELVLILTSRLWSKIEPLNYILFSAFAFISGLTLVPLIASFAHEFNGFGIIYRALFTTTATFLGAGLFGYTTKKSLSSWRGFLITALIGMLIVGIAGIFLPWGNGMEMLYSGFGVLLFTAYAAYDINRLKDYPKGEYINAAIQLYLDIFNLFIFILRLTGAVSRR